MSETLGNNHEKNEAKQSVKRLTGSVENLFDSGGLAKYYKAPDPGDGVVGYVHEMQIPAQGYAIRVLKPVNETLAARYTLTHQEPGSTTGTTWSWLYDGDHVEGQWESSENTDEGASTKRNLETDEIGVLADTIGELSERTSRRTRLRQSLGRAFGWLHRSKR
jgi:hypothetical protein